MIRRRTTIRFLVDECASPKLVEVAEAAGYDGDHVTSVDLGERPDELIAERALAEGAVVVTNNARDFRRTYARLVSHPGLVLLLSSVPRKDQIVLFGRAIAFIEAQPTIADQMVTVRHDETITIEPWPRRP